MISSETRKVGPFTGNDVTTVFPFTFKVFSSSDLLVVRAVTATGVESTLVLNSDYTVALNADQDDSPGGSVTLLTALASGTTLVVSSDVPTLQSTEITNHGGFFPEVITAALDKATILIQQQQEEIDRSIKFPISDAAALTSDLPTIALRKGKFLGFDATTGELSLETVSGTTGPQGPPGAAGGNGYVNTVSDASVPQGNSSGSGTTANAALTTAMSTYAGKTLMVPSGSVHHVTADLTITNQVDVGGAGGFYVDSGKVLTLTSPRLPFGQCFWGPGTVKVLGADCILPQWYGATGDGLTDDYAAIMRAIDQNPGAKIFFAPMSYTSTGATPTSFKSTQRISMNGQGQVLFGPTPVKRLGGSKLKFSSGVGGILMPLTYNAQGVHNLFLEGGDLANRLDSTTYANFTSLASITNMATSGIEAAGSSPSISGCRVSSFTGHGIEVYGSSGGQPDFWSVRDCYIDYNRAFGLFVTGTDANVGKADHLSLEGNLLGGLYDAAFYGNTHSMIHTSLNANNGMSAGASKTIAAVNGIVVSAGIATVTAVAHGMSAGQWVTSAGSDDAAYNETAKILTVADADHLTYATAHANGTTQNGTIAKSSSLQIFAYYTSKGIAPGPFSTHSTAGGTILITPYCESNQIAPVYNPNTILINPQGTAGVTATTGGHEMNAVAGPVWVFKGGYWVFQPLLAGDQLIVRNLAGDTNMWFVDISGNMTAIGTKVNLGSNPSGNSNAINTSNTWGLYSKTTGGSNSRGLYFHSDDTWYVGDSTRALHLQATATDVSGTLAVTGVSTLTGGVKVAAAGTTIKQITKLTGVAVDLGSIATVSRGSVAVTVAGTPGIAAGDAIQVIAGINGFNDDLIFEGAEATGANQVTFYFYNPTGAPIDDTSHNVDILWTDVT